MDTGRPVIWTDDKKDDAVKLILKEISESNKSLRSILDNADREILPSNVTFCKWLSEDEELVKQYAYACEVRQENKFNEILEIADNDDDVFYDEQGNKRIDAAHVQKKRLQIDARKWQLSKENPKKYGDRIAVDQDIKQITEIILTDATNID